MYDNLSERLNLYLWDSQLNMYYSDGSPYYNRTSGVNCLESSEPFIFYFYVPMVPTNGIWSGVKEAPIDYGVFDKTSKRNIQCPIHIGLVNIKSATWKYELINGTKIIRGNFCFFDLRVFSKDRSSFKDLTIQATVDELSFYILIINHYISTYKDLDSISIERLIKFRHIGDYDKLRGTAIRLLDNTSYADFVKYLYSADCITHSSCSYSFRKGEYRHTCYTSLTFKTQIIAFHDCLANILKGKSSYNDNLWQFTYATKETIDYSGGISVGPEKEGDWSESGDTFVKEDIVKDIINRTYHYFPDKNTVICKMIDIDLINNWNINP